VLVQLAHEEKIPAQPEPTLGTAQSSRAPLSRLAAAGKLVFGIFASLAEFERELLRSGREWDLRRPALVVGRVAEDSCCAKGERTWAAEKL
jgi:hypothetical protein